jgi:hypothetical protein
MSSKSFDEPDEFSQGLWTWNAPCKTAVANGSSNDLVRVKRGRYSGVSTPRYRQVVKEGGFLPQNAYKRTDYLATRDLGTYNASCPCDGDGPDGAGQQTGGVIASPFLLWNGTTFTQELPNPWTGVNTDALLIAAIADVLPDLDALTLAVEARETVDMLKNARRDAKVLIRDALRGGKHTVKAASDAWMAWRYGWQTLGYDIQAACEAFNRPYQSQWLEGRAGEGSTSTTNTTLPPISAGNGSFTQTYSVTSDVSVRANVNVLWLTKSLNVLVSPVTTLWETVPYSFVADWFINVGNVLAAWQVVANADRVSCSLGSKASITVAGHRSCTGIAPWSASSYASSSERYEEKTRVPASTPFLVPSINVDLTPLRLADAIAMFAKRIL